MTDPSPQQQPGYPPAEQQAYAQQQQAAYAAQQQAAHPQQGYQQPVPSPFVSNLPMNMLSLGLAGGGAAAILLAQIIAGGDLVGNLLGLPAAIVVFGALALTTGDKFRNFYRAATAGLTALVAGGEIGRMITNSNTVDAKEIIGSLLMVAGLCLVTAAAFTMSEPGRAPAAQPHAAQPTGHVQQPQATQQYPGQQPQQGGWQQ